MDEFKTNFIGGCENRLVQRDHRGKGYEIRWVIVTTFIFEN